MRDHMYLRIAIVIIQLETSFFLNFLFAKILLFCFENKPLKNIKF